MRRLALLALAGATLLVSGCSAVRLAYESADEYMRWRVGHYLDVSGEQAAALDASIAAFYDWHRVNALPQYASLFDDAGKRMARGMAPQDLDWGYDSVMAQARESLRRAATDIAPMLDGLKPEQIERLRERLDEDNRKFARDNLRAAPGERKQKRMRRTVDRLEQWTGPLSAAQLERVRQYSERAPLTEEMRDRERKRLQSEFLSIVSARTARRDLPERAAQWDRGRDPAFNEAIRANRAEYSAMMIDLDRTLTPAQRQHAVQRFGDLATDFRTLAARAGK